MRILAFALISGLTATLGCDDGNSAAAPGSCGGQVPEGQSCNSVVDVSTPITPTCVTGTMPVGTGGTIVDGTYTLAEQIYYNEAGCPSTPMGGTLVIAGNCVQSVNSQFSIASSGSMAVQGNSITTTATCLSGLTRLPSFTPDAPTHTFTATPTSFTLFTLNSAANNPNPDRVEVFVRR